MIARARWASDDDTARSGAQTRGLRRLGDAGLVRLARGVVHVFFREVVVTGAERIPPGSPVVFVANHNNSVVDSILLLALPSGCPRLLAKSTLFSHPVMGPLLALAGALPVFRDRDRGANVSRNFETFARCGKLLAAGGRIALFPEGESHNRHGQLPLKSGAARIVLDAEERLGPLGVRVVPVGLRYEAKDRFRSTVWVCVGSAIDPAAEIALVARWAGPAWGLAMSLVAPASGYAALRLREGRTLRSG